MEEKIIIVIIKDGELFHIEGIPDDIKVKVEVLGNPDEVEIWSSNGTEIVG